MKDSLRWSYALNQWNVRLDVFVRHEDQQRALKTVAACGFDTIELASGTGRWDNISRPEVPNRSLATDDTLILPVWHNCSIRFFTRLTSSMR